MIISLVHALGHKTVAEGVETGRQLDILKELGCDMIQGYYYSKPLPEEEFRKYLKYWGNDVVASVFIVPQIAYFGNNTPYFS